VPASKEGCEKVAAPLTPAPPDAGLFLGRSARHRAAGYCFHFARSFAPPSSRRTSELVNPRSNLKCVTNPSRIDLMHDVPIGDHLLKREFLNFLLVSSSGSKRNGGQLDILLHSIAFSPKEALHGRVIGVGRDGFLK
jgi:hypothetical protein